MIWTIGVVAASVWSRSALAAGPMFYLESFGPRGQAIANLTIALLVLSIVVILVISVLVLIGVWWRRNIRPFDEQRRLPVARGGNGVRWIYIGLS